MTISIQVFFKDISKTKLLVYGVRQQDEDSPANRSLVLDGDEVARGWSLYQCLGRLLDRFDDAHIIGCLPLDEPFPQPTIEDTVKGIDQETLANVVAWLHRQVDCDLDGNPVGDERQTAARIHHASFVTDCQEILMNIGIGVDVG